MGRCLPQSADWWVRVTRPSRPSPRGFSVIEVLVTMGLFSLMSLVGLMLLVQATSTNRRLDANEIASLQLKKAEQAIENDVQQSSYSHSNSTVVPSLVAGPDDGSALWLLSPCDPASGQIVQTAGGYPAWQRNILYYLIVPQDDSCPGGAGPPGLDDRCPHKSLIRKRINLPSHPEPLLTSVVPYLTRPVGKSCDAMLSEPYLEEVTVVANNLLSFEVNRDTDLACQIRVVLRAVAIEDAARLLSIGVVSLSADSHTQTLQLSLFPRN